MRSTPTVRSAFARLLACTLPMLALVACPAPVTQQGSVTASELRQEEFRQQQLVVRSQLADQQRVNDVGYPLLRSALALCGLEARTTQTGLRFANVWSFSKEYQPAARAMGFSDTLVVAVVAKGSAAERSGLAVGDRLVGVSDELAPLGPDAVTRFGQQLDRMRNLDDSFHFTVRHGSIEPVLSSAPAPDSVTPAAGAAASVPRDVAIAVKPDSACKYDLYALKTDMLNAWADGENVYVTSAMLRFANDDELAVVLSHEISHNAMGHIQAKKKSARIGGFFGAIIDVAAATQGINTGGAFSNEMAQAAAMKFSQDFEREADYVGLYVLARAGRPFANAPDLWRRMATESPASIKFASSHPTTAERFIRLEKTVAEIQAKQAAGQPLMPELKK